MPRVRAPKHIRNRLDHVAAGGGTPIYQALMNAQCHLHKLLSRMPELLVKCFLITDGRSRQGLKGVNLPGECTVIDIEAPGVKRGRAMAIAKELGATYLALNGPDALAFEGQI